MSREILKEKLQNVVNKLKDKKQDIKTKDEFKIFEGALIEIMQKLEVHDFGICEICFKIDEIGRGDHFFYNEDLNKWLCAFCDENLHNYKTKNPDLIKKHFDDILSKFAKGEFK